MIMQICFYCFYTNSSSANFSSYFYALEVLISYFKKKQTWISLHQNKLTFPHRQVRMSIINQVKISQWDQSTPGPHIMLFLGLGKIRIK